MSDATTNEMKNLLLLAGEEAAARYNGDVDVATGQRFDDWGYAEAERRAFVAGALFQSAKPSAHIQKEQP